MVGSDLELSGSSSGKKRQEIWRGRSGRRYQRSSVDPPRSGGMAVIYRVDTLGPPVGSSTVPEGTPLALKRAADDALALDTMKKEIATFKGLNDIRPAPPCPRLYDVIERGTQPIGLVMEWCPTDMERWWDGILVLPDAIEPLCRALSDVCRRIAEYHAFFAARGIRTVHADIKPRNVVLGEDGRWLIIDFGAAKSRPMEQESWDATRLILGTENFIAPEMLFNARKRFPEAMDTWSVALTFFTLLRMRKYRLEGNELPPDGTHNAIFRCHRMATVVDLKERKPDLFTDKDLLASAFTSPHQLPSRDRQAVKHALKGVFGEPDPARESRLEAVILRLLDKALAIDPAERFTRAQDLSLAFDEVVRAYWELEGSLPAAPSSDAGAEGGRPTVTEVLPDSRPTTIGDPPPLPPRVAGAAPSPAAPSTPAPSTPAPQEKNRMTPQPPPSPSSPPPAANKLDQQDTMVAGASAPAEGDPTAAILAELRKLRRQIRLSSGRAPFWLIAAVILLLFCQAIQFGLLIAMFLQGLGDAAVISSSSVAEQAALAQVAAPDEMPTSSPSSRADRRAMSLATAASTSITPSQSAETFSPTPTAKSSPGASRRAYYRWEATTACGYGSTASPYGTMPPAEVSSSIRI